MKKRVKKAEYKGIDTTEMLAALDELESSEGLDKRMLLESIQNALVSAYKKDFGSDETNVVIEFDKKDGSMHIYQEKTVVRTPEDESKEISLKEAHVLNKDYKAGDVIRIELFPKNFGRIAAQTAGQVIKQKIREASRELVFNEFSAREGEIVTGLVQKVTSSAVIMDLGKVEGIMPKIQEVSTEEYHVNDKIKAVIVKVEKGIKGSTKIVLSRTSPEFVRKLFEIEIPEIYEGVIEIKSISRDPGLRSKIAVYSPNPNIDPVGSCVGQKGIRIQNIINELNGEKIDVIEWNEQPETFISAALLPAQVLAVDCNDEENFAQVIVPDDQLSLAIGKSGQNARLAHKLTNWKIDIKSESQFREMLQNAQNGETEEAAEDAEVEEAEAIETVEEVVEAPVEEVVEEVAEEVTEKKTRKRKTKKSEEGEE